MNDDDIDDFWGSDEDDSTSSASFNETFEPDPEVAPVVEEPKSSLLKSMSATGKIWFVVVGAVLLIVIVVLVLVGLRNASTKASTPPVPSSQSSTTLGELTAEGTVIKVSPDTVVLSFPSILEKDYSMPSNGTDFSGLNPGDKAEVTYVVSAEGAFKPKSFSFPGFKPSSNPTPSASNHAAPSSAPPSPSSAAPTSVTPGTLGPAQDTMAIVESKHMDLTDRQIRYWISIRVPNFDDPIRLDLLKEEFDQVKKGSTITLKYQIDSDGRFAVIGYSA